ncbi:MAG: Rpn family recombination-promoting nuclease/putative transposase [Planctomycetes bacterium]|nr:Rpn family recombination-promoting nuclease/putative transposase [Planctomycetota bacterium]
MGSPHDELFRSTFRHAHHAAPWLRSVLPPALRAAIDWTWLRPAPESLHADAAAVRHADLVFAARRRDNPAALWLLAEHKSHRDPAVEDQLLHYALRLRAHGPRPHDRPPIAVLAVLLHHGEAPFAPPRRDDPFAPFQPRLAFLVDDLAAQDERTLRARDLTPLGLATLLCQRGLRDLPPTDALHALDRWADLLRAVDRDPAPPGGAAAIRALAGYALRTTEVEPRDLHRAFERILQRPEDTIMSTAEKLHREGLEQGLERGLAQGRTEGRTEGRIETILRLLGRRFGPLPPAVAARVRQGSPAELDRWTDRVLEAATLDGVFAD